MTINNQFEAEQFVYLKTDPDQMKRMVTAITIRGKNLMYELSIADDAPTWHQECEISKEEDVLMKVQ
jgi:hypothetical protein